MSIDIDIDKIAEDLNNKADLDMDNAVGHLGTAASNFFAGICLPSHRYVNLTLNASSEGSYTAPANGYFAINMTADAAGQHINMINTSNGNFSVEGVSAKSGNVVRQYLPVLKGDIITIGYATPTLGYFRFYYAEGAT